MPDRVPPPAPEGCVYGPWWDEESNDWLCVAPWGFVWGGPALTTQHFRAGKWQRVTDACEKELIRVAAERDELRAEVERLNQVIEKGHEDWRMNEE